MITMTNIIITPNSNIVNQLLEKTILIREKLLKLKTTTNYSLKNQFKSRGHNQLKLKNLLHTAKISADI